MFISPRIMEEEYIPFLLEICKKEKVDLVIPTIDTDLKILSEKKEEFAKVSTKALVSAIDKIDLCRNKNFTAEYFLSLGLSAPKTFNSADKYNLEFPAFIKPKDGSSSINAYKVEGEEQLFQLANKLKDYVVQPFIEGEEYTVDVFCDFLGNPILITPRKRIAVRAGEVIKTEICQIDDIIEEIKILVKDFRPYGPITVQLIRDKNGRNWYIEINPRFGGGVPCSIMAGANSPLCLLKLLLGEKIGYIDKEAEDGALYSRYDQSIRVDKCIE